MMFFNKLIAAVLPLMPQKIVWIFSRRYIAGQDLDDAIVAAKKLNREGNMVTIDLLGEFITHMSEAEENRDDYFEIIDRVEKSDIDGNYSLKPTMFGLLIDNCRLAESIELANFIKSKINKMG